MKQPRFNHVIIIVACAIGIGLLTLKGQPTTSSEAVEVEHCEPSSGVWSETRDETVGDGEYCRRERYERRLQQYTCTQGGEVTRQYNHVVSDWTLVLWTDYERC